MTAALELADVAAALAGRTVIEAVSLTVAPGELVGVLGANGCGKTTLLRAALGLIALSAGEARLADREVGGLSEAERASRAGYLPQERRIGWNLPAWRVAALGVPQQSPARAREIAMGALAEVAMTHLAERGVLDMSGGERARVLLARLIATGAPLLVADEPAASLDPAAQLLVMELLRARVAAGAAVLVTLHDLTLAARGCDRLAVMAAGRLIALGPPRQALAPDILAAAFALDGAMMETRAGPVIAARRVIP